MPEKNVTNMPLQANSLMQIKMQSPFSKKNN